MLVVFFVAGLLLGLAVDEYVLFGHWDYAYVALAVSAWLLLLICADRLNRLWKEAKL